MFDPLPKKAVMSLRRRAAPIRSSVTSPPLTYAYEPGLDSRPDNRDQFTHIISVSGGAMAREFHGGLAIVASLLLAGWATGDPRPSPTLVLRATDDTGLGANGSQIISIRDTDGIAALTNIAGAASICSTCRTRCTRSVCSASQPILH